MLQRCQGTMHTDNFLCISFPFPLAQEIKKLLVFNIAKATLSSTFPVCNKVCLQIYITYSVIMGFVNNSDGILILPFIGEFANYIFIFAIELSPRWLLLDFEH